MRPNLSTAIATLIEEHGYDAVIAAVKAAKPRKMPGRKVTLAATDAEAIWVQVELRRHMARRLNSKENSIRKAAESVADTFKCIPADQRLDVSAIRNLHLRIERTRKTDSDTRDRTDRILAAMIASGEQHDWNILAVPIRQRA